MVSKVVVQPSGKSFEVADGQFVLDAALENDVVLPYGCKDGACGSCKAKVLDGQIEQGPHSSGALKPADIEQGFALMCCALPQGDIEIEARVIEGVGDIPLRKMPARVASLEMAADDVAIIRLQLPATQDFQFLAGQYVEVILRDGSRREYSLGNAPHDAEQLELHIRHLPGGKFTDTIFADGTPPVKEKAILRFEGPMGTFFLREDSDKPIVMVASGTGFAPIKALIEHMIFKDIRRPVTLYWGGRRPADLYRHALCEQWAEQLEHLTYIPVISDALDEDNWSGRDGFVHKAVMQDFADLSEHQVYVCGAPVVVDAASDEFVKECGLPEEEFYADSFITEADKAS